MFSGHKQIHTALAVAFLLFLLHFSDALASTLPPGFTETPIGSGWNEVVGITFAEDGRMFVWERSGRIYLFHNNQWNVVIDIRPEVGGWRDHGLLGLALHPNFLNNGQIFLMYVVDRHHLLHFGTPNYNPNSNEYFDATIGRITRYTLDPANNFLAVVPGSRVVLLGESKTTGIPILFESHGVGTLLFGTDGTLLASTGDGASFVGGDTGGSSAWAYAEQALIDGIIEPKEDVGAFRSQLVGCHNGRILRIDPNTGDGVASNPFFNSAAPRAPVSRVWALGLRNPYRMTLRPGTGSHNPADGNPGVLYIGDVGWGGWEEINICTGLPPIGAQNFGWPPFEGMGGNGGYYNANIYNQEAANPLFGQGGCTQQYFYFRDLIHHDTLDPNPSYPNPCNPSVQVPDSVRKFVHRRPVIDWGNPSGPARAPIFVGNEPETINVGAPGSPISGSQFGGNSSIGGVWYTGTSYSEQYRNTYFHAEYGARWIKSIVFDANDKAVAVQNFATNVIDLVSLTAHPITGDLYYANWNGIYRISYAPTTNQPPIAVASLNSSYGASPLTVQFTGSASSDPENQPLQFHWNFGDGATSTQTNPSHTFTAPSSAPVQFNVTLTVTDVDNLTSQTTLIVSVNNSPPFANIISPAPGSTYPMTGNTVYHLAAQITDAEHDQSQIQCQWQVTLHHNNHTHPEQPIDECAATAVLSAVGCDGNTYFYRIRLMVTDGGGLSAFDEIDVHPDCAGNQLPVANNDAATVNQGGAVAINVLVNDTDADGTLDPATVAVVQPPTQGTTALDAKKGTIIYTHNGTSAVNDSFGYTVNDNSGGTSNVAIVSITVQPSTPGDITGDGVVNVNDLLAVINAWGPCPQPCPPTCAADVTGDCAVNANDLLVVINNWG